MLFKRLFANIRSSISWSSLLFMKTLVLPTIHGIALLRDGDFTLFSFAIDKMTPAIACQSTPFLDKGGTTWGAIKR